jgi:hypothetical protein
VRASSGSDDRTVESILGRLGSVGGYEGFRAQVLAARCCRRPVRLAGGITNSDGSIVFDSRQLPDGVLLKACGTRRETLCPPCASIYRGDAFAVVAAGLRGGKGVPEEIAEHPAVLLTLTAPSFGAVHRRREDGGCHRGGKRCPHGVALVCGKHHPVGDTAIGAPLCEACYDYEGAVLFNAGVSELWRRTTIYALRALGQLAEMSVRQTAKRLRLSYVKVVEFQRRGSVHLHALVRVDQRGGELGPAADGIDASMLTGALQIAARKVSAPIAGGERTESRVCWGQQIDTTVITDVARGRNRAAAYLAKYATKGSDNAGVLDHRLRGGVLNDARLPAHLRSLVETAWSLSERPALEKLRLRLWAHTCGFRGHFMTKSLRYSTTLGALREERQRWRVALRDGDESERELEDTSALVREWRYEGTGYLSLGDACLAENLEEQARLGRRVAYEEKTNGAGVEG